MRQFKRENSIVDCFPLLKKRKEKTRSPKPKKMGKLLLLEHNKVPTSGYHQMVEDDDSIVLVISEEGLVELNGIPMVTRQNDCGGVNPLGSTGEEEGRWYEIVWSVRKHYITDNAREYNVDLVNLTGSTAYSIYSQISDFHLWQ